MSSPVSARAAGIQFAAPNAAAAIDIQVDRGWQGRTAPRGLRLVQTYVRGLMARQRSAPGAINVGIRQ